MTSNNVQCEMNFHAEANTKQIKNLTCFQRIKLVSLQIVGIFQVSSFKTLKIVGVFACILSGP